MTVSTENIAGNTLQQDKVDTNPDQKKPDTNLAQNPPQQPPPQENKSAEGNPEDPNWRAFREARKKEREERRAAEQKAAEKEAEVAALKAAMEAAFSKQSHQVPNSNQDPVDETEDGRVKRLVQEEIARREAAYEQERAAREQQEYPQRLVKNYPDFHQVISQENLDYLDFHYPEVSRPLQRLGDGFDKWSDIYQAIKKFVPNNSTAKKESAKADVNFSKPKSISSTGITQPGEVKSAHILSEERKAANWARMQATMKGVGQ